MTSPSSVLIDGVAWYSGRSTRRFLGFESPAFVAALFIFEAVVLNCVLAVRQETDLKITRVTRLKAAVFGVIQAE